MNEMVSSSTEGQEPPPQVRSLRELVNLVTGRGFQDSFPQDDSGLAENLPFPFFGLVGQAEMKLALLLALINPNIGGVLLIGPRGTGKTTAVRSLLNLLPEIKRSTCYYGCTEEDVQSGGIDAICLECAQKYAAGHPLTQPDPVRLVELPLNARLEDVVGGLDERALVHERLRLKRGILAQADLNILYIDEVNLLANDIIDAILDAAAQGAFTVRRGPVSAAYNARFTLIGSMNPEEGSLRPQIMDRFGLRIIVRGLESPEDRLEAYQRVHQYHTNPRQAIHQVSQETNQARAEIQAARNLLPGVTLTPQAAKAGIHLIQQMKIDSLRAEITLFEAARAFTAADNRSFVEIADIRAVASMALRLRRSAFITQYFNQQAQEEVELNQTLDQLLSDL